MAKKLNVAVIGLGMGGGHLNSVMNHPNLGSAVICDINEERLSRHGDKHGIQARYTDVKEMYKNEALDAVIIALPNFLHAPMTIDALKRGLHVLCEKPMATTVKDAQKMAAEAKKAKKNLMINFSFRYSPMSYALKQQVDSGVVGDIYFGRTVWHRRRGMPGFGGWFGTKELSGGGPLIDLGVHRLDLALWLMGYPEVESVTGSTYNEIAGPIARKQKKKFDVEDLACGLIKFKNGATLILEASWAVHCKEREHITTNLYGTKGGLVQRNTDEGYEFEAELYVEEDGCMFTKHLDRTTHAVPNSIHEFINSIVEKRQPSATPEHGVTVMKILEGIYKSAATGKEVRYNSKKK